MKKIFFFFILTLIFSCSDDADHRINGMWQLKTKDHEGIISQVDTAFFSFQRGTVFSFTLVRGAENVSVSYGYLEFSDNNMVTIALETRDFDGTAVDDYGWNESNHFRQTFVIEQLDGKNMSLINDDHTIYTFKKY